MCFASFNSLVDEIRKCYVYASSALHRPSYKVWNGHDSHISGLFTTGDMFYAYFPPYPKVELV